MSLPRTRRRRLSPFTASLFVHAVAAVIVYYTASFFVSKARVARPELPTFESQHFELAVSEPEIQVVAIEALASPRNMGDSTPDATSLPALPRRATQIETMPRTPLLDPPLREITPSQSQGEPAADSATAARGEASPATAPSVAVSGLAPGGKRIASSDGLLMPSVVGLDASIAREGFMPATGVNGNADPIYPDAAKRAGIQGRTVLLLVVNSDGRVPKAYVVTTSGSALLDRAAIAAVLTWRLKPAMQDGQPIASTYRHSFLFRIPSYQSGNPGTL